MLKKLMHRIKYKKVETDCPKCAGTGSIEAPNNIQGYPTLTFACDRCKGSGRGEPLYVKRFEKREEIA